MLFFPFYFIVLGWAPYSHTTEAGRRGRAHHLSPAPFRADDHFVEIMDGTNSRCSWTGVAFSFCFSPSPFNTAAWAEARVSLVHPECDPSIFPLAGRMARAAETLNGLGSRWGGPASI